MSILQQWQTNELFDYIRQLQNKKLLMHLAMYLIAKCSSKTRQTMSALSKPWSAINNHCKIAAVVRLVVCYLVAKFTLAEKHTHRHRLVRWCQEPVQLFPIHPPNTFKGFSDGERNTCASSAQEAVTHQHQQHSSMLTERRYHDGPLITAVTVSMHGPVQSISLGKIRKAKFVRQ